MTTTKKIDTTPADVDAEKFLLASLINDNNLIEQADLLHKNHFYSELNGFIFDSVSRIIRKGLVADCAMVCDEVLKSQDFNIEIGREELDAYLKELEGKFTVATVPRLVNQIYIMYLKRNVLNIGKEMVEDATERPPSELADVIQNVVDKLDEVRDTMDVRKDSLVSLGRHIDTVLHRLDVARKSTRHISGISTGLIELDEIIGGLKNSDLVIIAARPSMGKTALAVSMAYNIARGYSMSDSGKNVLLFSLEMSGEQISTRVAAMHARKNSRIFETGRSAENGSDQGDFRSGKVVSDIEFGNISEVLQELSDLPLFIDSSPALKVSILRRKARKMHRTKKIGAIFVDYLQLVKGDFNDSSNRVQEVSEVTQALKMLARELDVPVIALAQLSRAVESREATNYKPQLSDLRESGSIEQDADIVMFLYREAYYVERSGPEDPDKYTPQDKRTTPEYMERKEAHNKLREKLDPIKNVAQVIVSKNRHGAVGVATCHFDHNFLLFSNLARGGYSQD